MNSHGMHTAVEQPALVSEKLEPPLPCAAVPGQERGCGGIG